MKIWGCLLLLFLFVPFVSSAIIIENDFDEIYNVGDLMEVNFSLVKDYSVSDFVEVKLDCQNKDFVLKKDYISLEKNEKKYIYLKSPLLIEGDCKISISFLSEEEKSNGFEISDKIIIDYILNDRFFLPGEKLKANGSVEKKNGEEFEGILKIKISELMEKSVEVVNGKFSFDYEMREDSIPKVYDLEFFVEEKNFKDEVINSGVKRDKVEILPKASSIEINCSEEVFVPFNFSIKFSLLDQIGREFENETIIVKIFDPLGDIVYQKEILSGDFLNYSFLGNSTKGGWIIRAYHSNILKVKPLYVRENMDAKVYFEGNKLYFENIGNVDYVKMVEYILDNGSSNNISDYLDISVPVGEKKDYLFYNEGIYNITIDGEYLGEYQLTGEPKTSGITGYSIFGDYEFSNKSYFVLGGVLIFLFLVWFFVFKKKVFKKLYDKNKGVEKNMSMTPKSVPLSKDKSKKLVVKEEKEEEKKPIVRKNYILFIESNVSVDNFESIVEKYGFKLNRVDSNLGYVISFNLKESNPDLKFYNLAKAIMRFSEVKKAKTSIVINRGMFENKLSLLKKFALLNRKLLKYSEGKILVTSKFFDSLNIGIENEKKVVEIEGRKLEVCLI
jgi:hypothetical protein